MRIIARKKIKKEVRYKLQLGQVVSFEVVQENEIDIYRSRMDDTLQELQ